MNCVDDLFQGVFIDLQFPCQDFLPLIFELIEWKISPVSEVSVHLCFKTFAGLYNFEYVVNKP